MSEPAFSRRLAAGVGLAGLQALLTALSGRWLHEVPGDPGMSPWIWLSSGLMLAHLLGRPDAIGRLALLAGLAAGLASWPAPARAGLEPMALLAQLLVLEVAAGIGRRLRITPVRDGVAALLRFVALAGAAAALIGLAEGGSPGRQGAGMLAQACGLLMVTPMAMLLARHPRLAPARQAGAVQCAGLGLTLLLGAVTADTQRQTRLADFEGEARLLATTLQNHLDLAQRDIERLRDLHYRIELDREEFERGSDEILRQSPWIRLFSLLPRVPAAQRPSFEDASDGLEGQSVREIAPDGTVQRAGRRAEFYPVLRTVPLEGQEALIGIDEAADPLRGPALRAAVDSGGTRASSSFSSLARTASEACVTVLYSPVPEQSWRLGEALTPQRVRAVVGATVDLGWMLGQVRRQTGGSPISLLLHEPDRPAASGVQLDAEGRVQPWSGSGDAAAHQALLRGVHARHAVTVGGRRWELLARPDWAGQPVPIDMTLAAVLASGLGGTLLVGAMLRARQRHLQALQIAHDSLERTVAQRTAALETSNRQLGAEIDERRRLEDDLRHASLQAQQASQAKTMFLANMSHEIRTPLNAVIGYTQILLEDRALPAPAHGRLRIILQAGQRLLRLINDVLDLSKIEAGGLQLHAAPFDLRQELDEIARLFEERAGARGLTLRCDIALPAREPVHGDRTKIGQIVMNLLSNAVKFTDRGEVALEVRRSGELVVIEVRDTGPGIGADELAQLFAPFRQGHAGLDKGGTGLGLVLARHMARAMGGELAIDSTPGCGTCACLRLPLPPGDDEVAASPVPAGALPGTERLDAATPVHAVVVEDDTHSRDILVHLLERLGCRVAAASDGLQGLRLIGRARPDIVFTDIRMPVLDGLRMLAQLKSAADADRRPLPPVVAVSASSLEHERRHYIAQGFSDFVGKPYAFEDILRMLALHAGARFVAPPADGPADAPPRDAPGPLPPAPAPGLDDADRTALETMRQAAADGQTRVLRRQLERLDQSARLAPAHREALHRAVQDYAFDDLARQVEALLASAPSPQDMPTP